MRQKARRSCSEMRGSLFFIPVFSHIFFHFDSFVVLLYFPGTGPVFALVLLSSLRTFPAGFAGTFSTRVVCSSSTYSTLWLGGCRWAITAVSAHATRSLLFSLINLAFLIFVSNVYRLNKKMPQTVDKQRRFSQLAVSLAGQYVTFCMRDSFVPFPGTQHATSCLKRGRHVWRVTTATFPFMTRLLLSVCQNLTFPFFVWR